MKKLISIALIVFISSCAKQEVMETEDTIGARLEIELTGVLVLKTACPNYRPSLALTFPF